MAKKSKEDQWKDYLIKLFPPPPGKPGPTRIGKQPKKTAVPLHLAAIFFILTMDPDAYESVFVYGEERAMEMPKLYDNLELKLFPDFDVVLSRLVEARAALAEGAKAWTILTNGYEGGGGPCPGRKPINNLVEFTKTFGLK
jgi:hypothetical protein